MFAAAYRSAFQSAPNPNIPHIVGILKDELTSQGDTHSQTAQTLAHEHHLGHADQVQLQTSRRAAGSANAQIDIADALFRYQEPIANQSLGQWRRSIPPGAHSVLDLIQTLAHQGLNLANVGRVLNINTDTLIGHLDDANNSRPEGYNENYDEGVSEGGVAEEAAA